MLNIKIIKNIIYLKYISILKDRRISKRFTLGTPIIVKDIITKKILVFTSISEAARYFNTYPKTIWRIVYSDKLYLDRYRITVKSIKYNLTYEALIANINKYSRKIIYMLLSIILATIFCIFDASSDMWENLQHTAAEADQCPVWGIRHGREVRTHALQQRGSSSQSRNSILWFFSGSWSLHERDPSKGPAVAIRHWRQRQSEPSTSVEIGGRSAHQHAPLRFPRHM